MKKTLSLFFIITCIVLGSCKKSTTEKAEDIPDLKGELPKIETLEVLPSSITSATCKMEILDDGGLPITETGVCWSTSTSPTIKNNINTTSINSKGVFEVLLLQIQPKITYYVRAYAKNAKGVSYGKEMSLFNENDRITLKTKLSYSTGAMYTFLNTVYNEKALKINEAGVCWATKTKPTTADNKSLAFLPDPYSNITKHDVRGEADVTMYFRTYAITNEGTFYGNEVSFKTPVAIGYFYKGGMIAYLNEQKDHGLIVSSENLGNKTHYWGPALNDFSYLQTTNASSLTNGAENTNKIIQTYGSNKDYAAKVCNVYRAGGFSDWYLPSIDELRKVFDAKSAIGIVITDGFYDPNEYWSSTEATLMYARYWNLSSTFTSPSSPYQDKSIKAKVRAVRAF